jgi:hypothetical protein
MKIGAKKDPESPWTPMAGRVGLRETQPISNLSSKFLQVYIQGLGSFFHIFCAHTKP